MTARPDNELRDHSTGDLLKELSDQTTTLVKQEIELAKAELAEKGKTAGIGAGMFGGAGLFAVGAFAALTTFFIALLDGAMPIWLAALIVAVVYAAVAGVLALTGKIYRAGAFPADFFFQFSVFLLCMVILGGIGSIWGVIAGGLILSYLDREGLATIGSKIQEGGLDFDPTKYQFGIYGLIIVVMMLIRPTGLIPERRHKIELEEGVHDTPFYDVQTEGAMTDRSRSDD